MAAPKTVATYDLDGSTREFDFSFDYLSRTFVQVTLIGTERRVLALGADYTFVGDNRIRTSESYGPPDWGLIEIRRVTPTTERLVAFQDASILRADDLNLSDLQVLHVAEEARDAATETIGTNNFGHLDARGRRLVNLGNAVDRQDAFTYGQYQDDRNGTFAAKQAAEAARDKSREWATSQDMVEGTLRSSKYYSEQAASSASASAASAAYSDLKATESANSATESANSATESANSATESANSATESANSATAAANSATAAASSEQASAGFAGAVQGLIAGATPSVHRFFGDGVQTEFDLGVTIINPVNVLVFLDGANQEPAVDYTVDGSVLKFEEAPADGVKGVAFVSPNTALAIGDASNIIFQSDDGPISLAHFLRGFELSGDNLSPSAAWSDVPKLKGEHANVQARALANRTEIIKSAVLTYPNYAAASGAAVTLPDGQIIVVDSERAQYTVISGGLTGKKALHAEDKVSSMSYASVKAAIESSEDVLIKAGSHSAGSLSINTPTKTVTGGAVGRVTLTTTSASNTFINVNAPNTTVERLTLSLDKGEARAGHGLAAYSDNLKINEVSIRGIGNRSDGTGGGSGVLVTTSNGVQPKYPKVLNSSFKGSGDIIKSGEAYGVLYDSTVLGLMTTSTAEGISGFKQAMSFELKNDASLNILSSLSAVNTGYAVGYGWQSPSNGCYKNLVCGLIADAAQVAVSHSKASGNLSVGVLHDGTNAPQYADGVTSSFRFSSGAQNNAVFAGMSLSDQFCPGAVFTSDVSNNFVEFAAMGSPSAKVARFNAGASRNVVVVSHPGASSTVASRIEGDGGNNNNPVYSYATGERLGSLSGYFYDFAGQGSPSALFGSSHRFRVESTTIAIKAFGTNGQAGNTTGITATTPTDSERGSVWHHLGATPSEDRWSIRGFGHGEVFRFDTTAFAPNYDAGDASGRDKDLGKSNRRWDNSYFAASPTITSDEREKTDWRNQSEAEKQAAIEIKGMIRAFRFTGRNRIHFGVGAQSVGDVMRSHGLDPADYAFWCYDEWEEQPEIKDEEGNIVQEYRAAGNRYGIRYDELAMFILAAM